MKCRGAVTLSFVYSCYCYKFYDLSCGFGGNLLLTTTFYIPALSSWEFVMHHTIYIRMEAFLFFLTGVLKLGVLSQSPGGMKSSGDLHFCPWSGLN